LIICGDALTELRKLPDESVNCCVTSPPYWGLRDYGVPGQLGLERTPEEYVAHLVEVFREVKRILRKDGTLWLNLGDSYAATTKGTGGTKSISAGGTLWPHGHSQPSMAPIKQEYGDLPIKPKDLVGIPWRVAFALQADGWWLRQDIIWAKPNPMPESVTDRCTKAHEYIFMLTKSARYWYDAEAVKEPNTPGTIHRLKSGGPVMPIGSGPKQSQLGNNHGGPEFIITSGLANRRSVWTIATRPYAEAHFATFPPEIPERCIKAGCPKGGKVIDPFFGAGTTGLVALWLGREFIGIELNEKYCEMARKRIYGTLGAEATA
jgi:DNA modification methylase